MRLLDTVVLIGSLNPQDPLHRRSADHLNRVTREPDVLVPAVSILEADLIMKIRGYTYDERRSTWQALDHKIPADKLLSNQISTIPAALPLQENGMDYFASLIPSLALRHNATVVTTDRVIK